MTKTTSKKSPGTQSKSPIKDFTKAPASSATKPESKGAAITSLLGRKGAATLDEMANATGWQKPSVRGFMAGALKKRHGLTVTSIKTEDGRLYRIGDEGSNEH